MERDAVTLWQFGGFPISIRVLYDFDREVPVRSDPLGAACSGVGIGVAYEASANFFHTEKAELVERKRGGRYEELLIPPIENRTDEI